MSDSDPSSVPEPGGSSADETLPRAARPAPTPAPDVQPGQRYEVRGEVARGGMGAILKVWDNSLRRTLAMKVVLTRAPLGNDPASSTIELDRFLEEAQITGQLDHPGVVPVHELGTDANGRVYFTMRLVKGKDYERVIELARAREEGWTETRALTTLHRVCETMAFAHAKGVVHRDLKPANIMVGQFGETYVMDWGLARVVRHATPQRLPRVDADFSITGFNTIRDDVAESSGSADLTREGTIVGTPCYMPPEQARGSAEVGPRADVYSVGCVLYQLLTGVKPYLDRAPAADAATVVAALLRGPPTPLHELAKHVPAELAAICEKAMSRDPDQRYPSMVEMADDLGAYLDNRVVHAYETGALAEFRKWVRRNRGIAASIAALALLALTSLVTIVWLEKGKVAAIANEELRTRQALDRTRRQTYVANVIAADLSLQANATRDAKRYLGECDADLRGWEWHHLKGKSDTSVRVATTHAGRVTALAFAPDGASVASAAVDRSVHVAAVDGSVAERSFGGLADGALAVRFNAAGNRLVVVGGAEDRRVHVFNPLVGGTVHTHTIGVQVGQAGAVSADGSRVAVATVEHGIAVLDVESGATLSVLRGHGDRVYAIAFASDGRLVSGGEDAMLCVWDPARPEPVLRLPSDAGPIHSITFRADGVECAAGTLDGSLVAFRVDTGARRALRKAHGELVSELSWSPDGTRLASASFDNTVRIWQAEDLAPVEILRGHELPVHALVWSSDGRWLATGGDDASVRVWRVGENAAMRELRRTDADTPYGALASGPRGLVAVGRSGPGTVEVFDVRRGTPVLDSDVVDDEVGAVAISRDGARVAAAFEEAACVRLWDLASGQMLTPALAGHTASVRSIAFHPDGTRVFSGSIDGTVREWDVATRSERETWLRGDDAVARISLARDGTRLAVGFDSGDVAVLVAARTPPSARWRAHATRVHAIAWSPDGTRIATAADRDIRVFDARDGALVHELPGHDQPISALAFAPDGTRLVSGSFDATLRVWDSATGRPLLTLRGHDGPVHDLVFTDDGARLVSTSWDGSLRVWIGDPAGD